MQCRGEKGFFINFLHKPEESTGFTPTNTELFAILSSIRGLIFCISIQLVGQNWNIKQTTHFLKFSSVWMEYTIKKWIFSMWFGK